MFCQQCGAVVAEGQTFCDDCNKKLFEQSRQGSPGDVFAEAPPPATPSSHVSQYLEAHSTVVQGGRPTGYQPAVRGARSQAVATGLSWATLALGFLVIGTTFLPWVSSSEFVVGGNPTGWTFLARGGSVAGGSFVWIKGDGIFYFSGLWALLAGVAMIAGAVLLLLGWRQGRWVAGVGGVIGLGAATVNVIMTFKLESGIGVGVWLFLLFSLAAVLISEFAGRYSE